MIIPYGNANFESIINNKRLYIDKTHFITVLEKSEKFFFIRPRRFGKSLWLSTLQYYYDINAKDKFEKLFGNLYIGKNPTELRNSYIVLKMDFSGLNTDNEIVLMKDFSFRIKTIVNTLFYMYADIYPKTVFQSYQETILNQEVEPSKIIQFLLEETKKINHKIYVLVDEYDNFINNLVSMGREGFAKNILSKTGFVRNFYEVFKLGSGEGVFERFFMTGVSPLMLDEMASGFNIMNDMTQKVDFATMLGFTESEVLSILDRIDENVYIETKPKQEVLKDMMFLYNGYRFNHRAKEKVFNPDMVLYFIQDFQDGYYPDDLLDLNVKTDYSKLRGLIVGLSEKKELRNILEELSTNKETTIELIRRFTFERRFESNELKSLLYYLGLLTYTNEKTVLNIPNYIVEVLYWEYFRKLLEEEQDIELDVSLLVQTLTDLAYRGSTESLSVLVKEFFKNKLSNMDYSRFSEKHVKIMLVSYLSMSKMYNVISEREISEGKRMDLLLEGHPSYEKIQYNFIIELKYIRKEIESQQEEIRQEAIEKVKKDLELYSQTNQYGRLLKCAVILVRYDKETEVISII